MSLTGVIARFSTALPDGEPSGYVVTRVALGAVDPNTGVYVEGGASTLQIDASIQPYSGHGLKPLPEGTHAENVIVIYTATELLVSPRADHINYRGEDHEVIRVNGPYTMGGVSTYTVYAARQVVP